MLFSEVNKYYSDNPEQYQLLRSLFIDSIKRKSLNFDKKQYAYHFGLWAKIDLVVETSKDSFQLNYSDLAIGQVLFDVAIETLKQDPPPTIIECLRFVHQFCEEIRKPNLNFHWNSDLEPHLACYVLVHLNHSFQVDITAYLLSIPEEINDDIREILLFQRSYLMAIPSLNDDIAKTHQALCFLFTKKHSGHDAMKAIDNLVKANIAKAKDVYEYAKANGGIAFRGYLPTLQIGFFNAGDEMYYSEALELFKSDNIQGLITLASFKYYETKQIKDAYNFVQLQVVDNIEYIRNLPQFYAHIITNKLTPEETVNHCFDHLRKLSNTEDDILRRNLVWNTEMLQGYDKEKYGLLENFMSWGNPSIIGGYFNNFETPKYLFGFIKDAFLAHGIRVNFDLVKMPLHNQYAKNPELFRNELLNLLTEKIPILRFAGLQILINRYAQPYELDLLSLSEINQTKIIETLLGLPYSIEDLLPVAIQLRNSPFNNVKATLRNKLIELIQAYEIGIIDLANLYLNDEIEGDKMIAAELQKAYTEYSEEKKLRQDIIEFKPLENELEYLELFYRLEHEIQTEMMEKANEGASFHQFAKTVSVIRGSGFAVGSNKNISQLGVHEFSRMVDQRIYINPDAFEWNSRTKYSNKED